MENSTVKHLLTSMMGEAEGNLSTTGPPVTSTTLLNPRDDGRFLIPTRNYTYDTNEFEIFLPCIFGMFIILCLGLMTFYTKKPKDYDPKAEKNIHNYTPTVTNEIREDLFSRKDEDRGMRSIFSSLEEETVMRKSIFEYSPRSA